MLGELANVYATTNSFQAAMKVKIAVVTIPGRASGRLIILKVWKRLAPSINAASSISTGIDWKKLERIHTEKAILKEAFMRIKPR